jgi:capsular polysaccharide export protein
MLRRTADTVQTDAMGLSAPLLRSPPYLGPAATVSGIGRSASSSPAACERIDQLFAAIRDARVGGAFWARSLPDRRPTIIVRARSAADAGSLATGLSHAERANALWLLPKATSHAAGGETVAGDIDPWSLLRPDTTLLAHGDDEWVALAHIAGCPVRIASPGRFGAPGSAPAEIRQAVAAHLLGATYRDPFTDEASDAETVVTRLADWRRVMEVNRGIVAACGIAWWKRHEIARFLATPAHPLRFFLSERRAIRHAARQGGAIAVWPSRISAGMAQRAAAQGVPLVRVEDGFVRSVGLGSNLVPPSSITVDRQGIHYDPGRPSDLEAILAEGHFPAPLLERAERLRETILSAGISKYGGGDSHVFPERQPGRRLVLVPGQVEDDMSVRLGGAGLASNLELVRRARALEPDAEIWFRPHPDVDAGHRKGAVPDAEALRFADRIVRGGGMARLLDRVDAVHVLTSLTGFEALLRGHAVTCHGVPFYAGWGLTRDLAPVPERRGRPSSLAELIAAVLILYPRYLDPVTGLPCPPEILISRMTDGADHNRLGWVTRLRQVQGRLMKGRR